VYFALKRRGLRGELAPSPEITSGTPQNLPEQFPKQVFQSIKKAACLKLDMSVSKQTATFTPLFAALRLLFALIMQA